MSGLTPNELQRYSRHLMLQGFGPAGQQRLKNAKVLVIGAGGLGSPALLYLAAAGIGTLGIVDFDTVELSNLQRQILFTVDDVGQGKAETAARRLRQLNPDITITPHPIKLTATEAQDIIRQYDIVLDGSDNFATRYLVNDACVLLDKPLVYGSILRYEGQVAVFNVKLADGHYSTNYRDLFPIPPDPGSVPDCSQAGVLGVLPGLIGTLQASEVIKVVTGIGEPAIDQLVLFDSLTLQQTTIRLQRQNARAGITHLIDYDEFCGISQEKSKSLNNIQNSTTMKEVTVQELEQLIESGADFQLIDVREPHEYDIANLDGELIPQAEIPANVDRIAKDKQVILHCRSGARSGNMVQWLEKNHNFTNLYNLKGGILAWAKEIDPSMPQY